MLLTMPFGANELDTPRLADDARATWLGSGLVAPLPKPAVPVVPLDVVYKDAAAVGPD